MSNDESQKINLDELRDVFAAAALNGFLSAGAPPNDWAYVHAAYQYADMMIAARSQT